MDEAEVAIGQRVKIRRYDEGVVSGLVVGPVRVVYVECDTPNPKSRMPLVRVFLDGERVARDFHPARLSSEGGNVLEGDSGA